MPSQIFDWALGAGRGGEVIEDFIVTTGEN